MSAEEKNKDLDLKNDDHTENKLPSLTNDDIDSLKDIIKKNPKEAYAVIKKEGMSIKIARAMRYTGPIPHPSTLKGYKEVDPSFPDRIVKLVENDQAHKIDLINTSVNNANKRNIMGMWFGFIIAVLSLCAGTFLIYLGKDVAGIAAIFASLTGVLAVFIVKQTKDKDKKRDNVQ